MRKTLAITALLLLSACTDATCSRAFALGDAASVKCYSGTEVIYEGQSTGRVDSPANSDGYLFKDAATGELVEVSGNCIISYAPPAAGK